MLMMKKSQSIFACDQLVLLFLRIIDSFCQMQHKTTVQKDPKGLQMPTFKTVEKILTDLGL